MDFFINPAYAQAAGAPAAGGFSLQQLLFPALLLVVFYFLLIRPQSKKATAQYQQQHAHRAHTQSFQSRILSKLRSFTSVKTETAGSFGGSMN